MIDYLRDILILAKETFLLFLLWILYIKLCQSFPSPNLVYSIMPPAHIEAENKQKGQKFWCVKTEVCRQACFINEIITLTKSTAISNSIFNKKMTNSQLQHIIHLFMRRQGPMLVYCLAMESPLHNVHFGYYDGPVVKSWNPKIHFLMGKKYFWGYFSYVVLGRKL